jgi:hypothetical protein
MNRNREIEKKFNEYLDHILAGEEVILEPGADEDFRTAVEFADKMFGLRPVPSEVYRNDLISRLLRKLGEREAAEREKRESVWKKLWRQPIWQGAVMVAFAVIVVSLLWRAGTFSPGEPEATTIPTISPTTTPTTTTVPTTAPTTPPTSAPTTAPTVPPTTTPQVVFISVYADTDKSIYQSGEEVQIVLLLTNDGPVSITLEKLPPIVSLMATNTQKPVFTFASGTETRVIAPNQTIKFTMTWDQRNFDGEPVTGSFYIEVEDLVYLDQLIQLHLDSPVQFDIIEGL